MLRETRQQINNSRSIIKYVFCNTLFFSSCAAVTFLYFYSAKKYVVFSFLSLFLSVLFLYGFVWCHCVMMILVVTLLVMIMILWCVFGHSLACYWKKAYQYVTARFSLRICSSDSWTTKVVHCGRFLSFIIFLPLIICLISRQFYPQLVTSHHLNSLT